MPPTAAPTSTAYEELVEVVREGGLLGSTLSLLGWDQEVMMPPRGVEFRGEQLAQVARLRHETLTSARLGDLLAACEGDAALTADPADPAAVNVREIRREYDRRTKLPPELVQEEARLKSMGQHVWAEARRKSDFEMFRPHLEKIVGMLRRKAECYGWGPDGEPWDALADDYEPGCTAREIEQVFAPLRERLRELIAALTERGTAPADAFEGRAIPVERQERFVRFVARAIGFDFERGRLDVSTHPFCSGTHCRDVRMTTRFRETDIGDALGGTMHEAGHGLYEQGLPYEHVGTPMGEAVSLGIHESQSRMWENQVGRSRAFWTWCHPRLEEYLGPAMRGVSAEDAYASANIVRPSLIRVEADEATYDMHVLVRFEIERAILAGDLAVRDVPDVWNRTYRAYLGVEVPDDARGCLQDIHWSMAAMGYFPTYTLGNLYAAQLFEKVREDLPDLDARFARGEFGGLLAWLNENVHAHGRRYRAADLCERVTGRPLSAEPLMRHLEGKLKPLYGL